MDFFIKKGGWNFTCRTITSDIMFLCQIMLVCPYWSQTYMVQHAAVRPRSRHRLVLLKYGFNIIDKKWSISGNDPLLQILYETDRPQEKHDITRLQEIPVVWRYRAMITVNHLRQNLDATKEKFFSVLRLFLKEVRNWVLLDDRHSGD